MDILFGILILVGLITLLGHANWLFISFLIRTLSDKPKRTSHHNTQAAITQLHRLFTDDKISTAEYARLVRLIRNEPAGDILPDLNFEPNDADSTKAKDTSGSQQADEIVTAEIASDERISKPPVQHALPPISHPVETQMPVAAMIVDEPSDFQEAPQMQTTSSSIKRSLADVLQSFMEERNIRWGELISGMLVVGSAIGLVVSLRNSLSDMIPYFPALLFMLATLAIHGAGLYTLHRWDLKSTSRGVLMITILLVPLNFLAAISLTGNQVQVATTDINFWIALLVGTVVFGWVLVSSSRVLLNEHRWRIPVAVLGASLGQVMINRLWQDNDSISTILTLLALPMVAFCGTNLLQLIFSQRWKKLSAKRVEQLYLVLGFSVFALLPVIGLIFSRTANKYFTLVKMTPMLALVSACVVCTGLFVHSRVVSRKLAALRSSGTSLLVLGQLLCLGCIYLALPMPDLLLINSLLIGVLMISFAILVKMPMLHLAGSVSLMVAYLTGFYLMRGEIGLGKRVYSIQWIELLFTSSTMLALTVWSLLMCVVGLLAGKTKEKQAAFFYFINAAVSSGIAVLLALFLGFIDGIVIDASQVSLVLMFYSLILIVVSYVRPHRTIAFTASFLLLISLVHLFARNPFLRELEFAAIQNQWLQNPGRLHQVAFLVHGLLMMTITAVAVWFNAGLRKRYRSTRKLSQRLLRHPMVGPFCISAMISSGLVLLPSIWVSDGMFTQHALCMLSLSASWLLLTLVLRDLRVFAIFQGLLSVSVGFAVASISKQENWGPDWFIDLRHIESQLIALAISSIAWCSVRQYCKNIAGFTHLVNEKRYTVDRFLLAAMVSVGSVLLVFRVVPAVANEMSWDLSTDIINWSGLSQHPQSLTWVMFGLVLIAVWFTMYERFTNLRLAELSLIAFWPLLIIAKSFHEPSMTISWLQWSLALAVLLISACLLFAKYFMQQKSLQLKQWIQKQGENSTATLEVAWLPVLISAFAVMYLAISVLARTYGGQFQGESIFTLMVSEGSSLTLFTTTLSFAGPIAVLLIVFILCALIYREQWPLLAASALFAYTIGFSYIHWLVTFSGPFTEIPWLEILTWITLETACFSVFWIMLDRWFFGKTIPQSTRVDRSVAFVTQLLANLTFMSVIILVVIKQVLWMVQGDLVILSYELAGWQTYLSLLITFGVTIYCFSRSQIEILVDLCSVFIIALSGVIALSCYPYMVVNLIDLGSYKILLGGWLLVVAAAAIASTILQQLSEGQFALNRLSSSTQSNFMSRFSQRCFVWAVGLSVVVTFLTLLGYFNATGNSVYWLTVLAVILISILMLAVMSRSTALEYYTLALSFAITCVAKGQYAPDQTFVEFIQWAMLSSLFTAALWLVIELWSQRSQANATAPADEFSRIYQVIAYLITAILLLVFPVLEAYTLIEGSDPFTGTGLYNHLSLSIISILGVLILLSFWNRNDRETPMVLGYGWSLIAIIFAIGLTNQTYEFEESSLRVITVLSVSAFLVLIGWLWMNRVSVIKLATWLRIPHPNKMLKQAVVWLPEVNNVLILAVILPSFAMILSLEVRWMRLTMAMVPLMTAYNVAMFCNGLHRNVRQFQALMLATLSAALLAWADMSPTTDGVYWLLRLVRLMIVLSGAAFFWQVIVARMLNEEHRWISTVRRVALVCGSVAVIVVLCVLAGEVIVFNPPAGLPVEYSLATTITVSVMLIALAVSLITMAVVPNRDPLLLSVNGRMLYVYAAEVVLALLGGHIYLAHPKLFTGAFLPYWPFIVMAIAYAAVGMGEAFKRSGIRVLSEPLERTGCFLPLLPVLGFWVITPDVSYSAVMFTVGLLFILMSIVRPSPLNNVLAALAGNAAIWSLLWENDYQLINHPQLWLILPALSVLVAAQINKSRLSQAQLGSVRYLSVMVIYLSSTGELFIQGIGRELWPPMVLMLLSVVGVLLGIALRIRAFLYLGASFLMFSLIAMVWHASTTIEHPWPWWAFGIVLGICIMTMFGVLEKKRSQVQSLIHQLRQWDR